MDKSSIIFEMEFGTEISDKIYKGIYLPHAKDIILGRVLPIVNIANIQLYSLSMYMEMLLNGDTVCLDMLFCPRKQCLTHTDISHNIVSNKHRWLSKEIPVLPKFMPEKEIDLLPEKPDFEFAEDFIFNTYYNRIKEEVLDLT